jgi:hypothetical protein
VEVLHGAAARLRRHQRGVGVEAGQAARASVAGQAVEHGMVNRTRTSPLNLWARLKEWRAVATRYEKTARSFLGVLHLAAALDWLKREGALA